MFKAFGRSLTKEDKKLINNMATVITNENIEIYDLNSYELNINPDDTVLLFGAMAVKLAENIECAGKATFPEPKRLNKNTAQYDENLRQAAFDRLTQLKKLLSEKVSSPEPQGTVKILSKEHLSDPNLVLKVVQEFSKQEPQTWKGITKGGKTIKLSNSYKEDNKNDADINMTFSEFLTLKWFMDVFGVMETSIVYKPNTNKENNNKQTNVNFSK